MNNRYRLLPILFWMLMVSAHAQSFSFKMFFRDAAGNKDTIEIGMDPNGTIGVDTIFQEENIIGQPFGAGLSVRVGDCHIERFQGAIGNFAFKKQILRESYPSDIITIDVKSDNYPVTASWDKTLFEGVDLLSGTLLTSTTPGGWWDVGSPSNLNVAFLASTDSVQFTANYYPGAFYPSHYFYFDNFQDTVSILWFVFGPPGIGVGVESRSSGIPVRLFPNPSYGEVYIENEQNLAIRAIEIWDITGTKQKASITENKINIDQLPQGIYFVKIWWQGSDTFSLAKVLKQR